MKPERIITNIKKFPSSLQSRAGWSDYFELRRSSEPHVHQIEPTNHCPYTCVMCPRSENMTRALGFMEMDIYKKIIGEISTYSDPVRSREIELFHFGESLLHPEIVDMIALGSERHLKMTLSVNAPHLTPELADKILSAKPFKIIVSLDGHDQKSYQQMRGKMADYAKAEKHIDYLLKTCKERASDSLIVIRMIRMAKNEKFTKAFQQKWGERGAETDLRTFFPWTEPKMADLGQYEKYPPFMPCPFPWQYLVIQWDGSIVPCCRDYNSENIMGNVREQSLREIWNGKVYRDFRKEHETGSLEGNNICTECMSIYYTPK